MKSTFVCSFVFSFFAIAAAAFGQPPPPTQTQAMAMIQQAEDAKDLALTQQIFADISEGVAWVSWDAAQTAKDNYGQPHAEGDAAFTAGQTAYSTGEDFYGYGVTNLTNGANTLSSAWSWYQQGDYPQAHASASSSKAFYTQADSYFQSAQSIHNCFGFAETKFDQAKEIYDAAGMNNPPPGQ